MGNLHFVFVNPPFLSQSVSSCLPISPPSFSSLSLTFLFFFYISLGGFTLTEAFYAKRSEEERRRMQEEKQKALHSGRRREHDKWDTVHLPLDTLPIYNQLGCLSKTARDARRRRGARKSVKLKGFTGFLKGSEGFAGVAPAGLKINRFC